MTLDLKLKKMIMPWTRLKDVSRENSIDQSENRFFLEFSTKIEPSSLLVTRKVDSLEVYAIEKIPWLNLGPVVLRVAKEKSTIEENQGLEFKATFETAIDVESLRYDEYQKKFIGLKDSGLLHASKKIIDLEGNLFGEFPVSINSYSLLKTSLYAGIASESNKKIIIQGDDSNRAEGFKKGINSFSLRVVYLENFNQYELIGIRNNSFKEVINREGYIKVKFPMEIDPRSLVVIDGDQRGLASKIYCAGAINSRKIIFTDPLDNKNFYYLDSSRKFFPESLRYSSENQSLLVVHKDYKTVEVMSLEKSEQNRVK